MNRQEIYWKWRQILKFGMGKLFKVLVFLLISASLSAPGTAKPNSPDQEWQEKVDQEVLLAALDGEAEFIIFLSEQADLSNAETLKTKLEKGGFVYQQLTGVAQRTQGVLIEELRRMDVQLRSFWIANMIWVKGDLNHISAMAKRPEVAHIYANPQIRMTLPSADPLLTPLQVVDGIEWNISQVRAPEVWAAGHTGQGITVGGQDTGYEWQHPALKGQYRGWNGSTADHNYHWHDAVAAIYGSERACSPGGSEPCDDNGHGTHTMGTMVGMDGNNQIGMAPDAQWIGCRNMDHTVGSPATYIKCYEWFVAPTDINDQHPDPAKAPDVINNSWYCPESEGCTDPQILKSVVDAVRAAGILTVHSAGNDGPACSTIDSPAAIYDASFTVGNTTNTDQIAASSSRGPVTVDESGRIKPNISAPGTSIRSSWLNGGYRFSSGTSMAAPHVAGLAALLFSARSELTGEVDQVEYLITRNAVPLAASGTTVCGEIAGDIYPNNISGWGRIDAWNAFLAGQNEVYFPLIGN